MKEITVISGKGGTGKTTVTAALASLAENLVLCDSDVDAPDLHLVFKPKVRESHQFKGSWIASIDPQKCTGCGMCSEVCKFDAISVNETEIRMINSFKCEGCRLCERVCPSDAITSKQSTANSWYVSSTRVGTMTHASMGPGEENSGKLVTQVRRKAKEIAKVEGAGYILTDGPPGTGCPAIASLTGTRQVLLVMEPSASSLHDARRVIELVRQFGIPIAVLINKWDIHPDLSEQIEHYLNEQSIPILGKLPFDESTVEALIYGQTMIEFAPDSEFSRLIKIAWNQLIANISMAPNTPAINI